jgi:hypothetical protein
VKDTDLNFNFHRERLIDIMSTAIPNYCHNNPRSVPSSRHILYYTSFPLPDNNTKRMTKRSKRQQDPDPEFVVDVATVVDEQAVPLVATETIDPLRSGFFWYVLCVPCRPAESLACSV